MQQKKQIISPIKQNILHFIDTLNISKRDFYQKTGISRGTLESNTGITEDTLAKLFAAFPNLNIEWIFFSKGNITNDTKKDNYIVDEPPPEYGLRCENCVTKEERIRDLLYIIEIQKELIQQLKEQRDADVGDASVAAAG